jgi:hypothetical protein
VETSALFAVLTIGAAALSSTIKVDADPVQYLTPGHALNPQTTVAVEPAPDLFDAPQR